MNKRAAEKKLRRLINENFQEGDTHLVLDYRKERRPAGRKQMREDADDFLREMRKLYKRHGIPFKYIHVMEIGKKGALHHHLVINTPEEISQQAIVRCWKGRGRTHHNPLDDTGQYAKLASYLIKQSDGMLRSPDALQGKRWNSSRNLRKPKVLRKEPVKDKGWYNRIARLPKKLEQSYYLDGDSVQEGIHEKTGYTFFTYTFVKINRKELDGYLTRVTDKSYNNGYEQGLVEGIALAGQAMDEILKEEVIKGTFPAEKVDEIKKAVGTYIAKVPERAAEKDKDEGKEENV